MARQKKARKNKKDLKEKQDSVQKKERWALTFFISGCFFGVLFITLVIAYFIFAWLFNINLLSEYNSTNLDTGLLLFIGISIVVVISYVMSFGLSKLITIPVNKVINSLEKLAAGKYNQRLYFKNSSNFTSAFSDLSDSFNKLANELEHTETLSNDFINNFSHEFKTPIVSIAGFAKLLQKGNLTPEQQKEYLNIIEEESSRLANLSKGVLDMIKIENQSILTNITRFNLSEQLRNCMLLLENKWSEKNLNLELNFDEYDINGNEELLKHVWINLFDNAIKFTPMGQTVAVEIKRKGKKLQVQVANTGSVISSENQKHIFNKFYQADTSHSTQGHGIGLAVVKKIVVLHKGTVSVISGNNKTIFTVSLPE